MNVGFAEELRWHERMRRPALHQHEDHQRHQADGDAGEQHRIRAAFAETGEPVGERTEAGGGEHGAGDVEPGCRLLVAGLRHVPQRDGDDQRGERQVDQEDQPPAPLHQPAAEERPDRTRDPAEPGPCPDCGRAVRTVERRRDDREAARREQRPADALCRPRGDEQLDVRGEPAGERGQREPDHADDEDPPTSEMVAQRATEQDERGERERVGVDGPLQVDEARRPDPGRCSRGPRSRPCRRS